MSYKREIPRLNRDNFLEWQGLMRLHLASIDDSGPKYLDAEYVEPTDTLFINGITEKKTHNNMMIDISFSLSHAKFDEVKYCKKAHEMWIKLKEIYGGDDNVRRAKI